MKIGILTFHWATNYGAILQAYALQKYLVHLNHEVYIINYHPYNYDISWKDLLVHPGNLLHLKKFINNLHKEHKLSKFRNQYLNMTDRYARQNDITKILNDFDILISGSDQVLNPYYTLYGEGYPTSVYYLDFPDTRPLKLGYALSFGCSSYPEAAAVYASRFIRNFDRISVREDTGSDIIKHLGYSGSSISVPDPTILLGKRIFDDIAIRRANVDRQYTCVYMLRRRLHYNISNAVYIDDKHSAYSMEEWLALIRDSRMLVTNSYHGMIMAILFHVPFIIEIETGSDEGMNDRFITLLRRIGLTSRIDDGNNFLDLLEDEHIDWNVVDRKLEEYRLYGQNFLKFD